MIILAASHNANFDLTSSVRRESNSGAYFAGMFRVANVEFIPEYRQEESQEFVSMANKIQHVVRINAMCSLNNIRSENTVLFIAGVCWCR